MLIDKNKNKDKVVAQAITKAAATASQVNLGRNDLVCSGKKLVITIMNASNFLFIIDIL